MEGGGLVERDTHPTDARARTFALTAKGLRAYRRLWTAGDPARARMIGALRPGEAESLVGLLTRVAEALNAGPVSVGGSTSPRSPQEDEP